MNILLVTDAWMPQVNGVVTTLVELAEGLRQRGHRVEVIHPGLFRTWPCPGFAGIALALERCGRLSDGWLPSQCTPEEAAEGRKVIDDVAAKAGRIDAALAPRGVSGRQFDPLHRLGHLAAILNQAIEERRLHRRRQPVAARQLRPEDPGMSGAPATPASLGSTSRREAGGGCSTISRM